MTGTDTNVSWNELEAYFCAPRNHFWKWAEDGSAVEWADGSTLCLREELHETLRHMLDVNCSLPLGTVLLILDALRGPSSIAQMKPIVTNWSGQARNHFSKEDLDQYIRENTMARFWTQNILSLPEDLRTGHGKAALFHLLGELSRKESVDGDLDEDLFREWNSGKWDAGIYGGMRDDWDALTDELDLFTYASELYPTPYALERAVRTGMKEVPPPAPVEIPEPEPETGLLEQLEDDKRTHGVARLTRRLIAALNIPLHAKGPSDQSFGGVSDITNRGDFDRLLLSELAYDDLTLMARLANNEALYLRREELPSVPDYERVLLIDTTIRLWGIPKAYAMSAALACTFNNKYESPVSAFSLSGFSSERENITDVNGIVTALEKNDAAMHCGNALHDFYTREKFTRQPEVFLITTEEGYHHPEFQKQVQPWKRKLRFLITVNRNGEIRMYEFINGVRTPLLQAKMDLEALLFAPFKPQRKHSAVSSPEGLPAYLSLEQPPLLFPCLRVRMKGHNTFYTQQKHVLTITEDDRLLCWTSKDKAAIEICHFTRLPGCSLVKPGTLTEPLINPTLIPGIAGDRYACLMALMPQGKGLWMLVYDLTERSTAFFELTGSIDRPQSCWFMNDKFYVRSYSGYYAVDPGRPEAPEFLKATSELWRQSVANARPASSGLSGIKSWINNGHSGLTSVSRFWISPAGVLTADHRELKISEKGHLVWQMTKGISQTGVLSEKAVATVPLNRNGNLKFFIHTWQDGSQIWTDSRGLIYLRSSDRSIPEMALHLVIDKPISAWTSDGNLYGSLYFLEDGGPSLPVQYFVQHYLQPFIRRILSK